MKKLVFLFIIFLPTFSFSQAHDPVKWEAKFNELPGTDGEIVINARIENGWHIYSIKPTDAGPIPTSFNFSPDSNYELIGKTEESNAHEILDKAFDAKLWIIEEKGTFKQKIKLKNQKGFSIPVKLEFMVCNDMQCLPPKTIELQIIVPAQK